MWSWATTQKSQVSQLLSLPALKVQEEWPGRTPIWAGLPFLCAHAGEWVKCAGSLTLTFEVWGVRRPALWESLHLTWPAA